MCHLRGCECGTSSAPPRCEIRLCISIFQADVQDKAAAKTNILPKAGKINFSIRFQVKVYQEKAVTKPRSCQKLQKKQFIIIFRDQISIAKSTATKTKILPKAGKINCSILFQVKFNHLREHECGTPSAPPR